MTARILSYITNDGKPRSISLVTLDEKKPFPTDTLVWEQVIQHSERIVKLENAIKYALAITSKTQDHPYTALSELDMLLREGLRK